MTLANPSLRRVQRSRLSRIAAAALSGLFLLSTVLTGCTDARLERLTDRVRTVYDDRVSIEGDLCTRPPENLIFPLRVLFVIDSSESMRITDPADPVTGETERERAVREAWTELLSQGREEVRVGVIRFSAQAQSRTPVDADGDGLPESYFSNDPVQLEAATQALSVTDRTTNYLNAMGEAYYELRAEMSQADLESLPLSKYVVVFLSDGLPDLDDSEARDNALENIIDSVVALKDLARLFRVGDFAFHTAYLSAGQGPAVDQPAQDLLQRMAEAGGGSYRSFPNGEAMNFLGVDLTVVRRVFTLQSLVAVNQNTVVDGAQLPDVHIDAVDQGAFVDLDGDGKPGCGEPLADSDGDGLVDVMEARVGSNPLVPDTDDDGLGDRVEWVFRASGQDPLDPDDAGCFVPAPCFDDDMDGQCDCLADADMDGVCDCVSDDTVDCMDASGRDCLDEDGDLFCDCPDLDGDGRCDFSDRDGDGLGDCEEVFFGTAQSGADTDADGLPDSVEVHGGTSPTQNDGTADFDWDETPNDAEVRAGSDPTCDDSEKRTAQAVRYHLESEGLNAGRACYQFAIDNVRVVSTMDNPDAEWPGNGKNRIMVYAGEVAVDDPDAFASYRVACVDVTYERNGDYKDPPSGKLNLTDADFIDVRAFDPERDCHAPRGPDAPQ